MERAYPYKGYSINVRIESEIEPATLGDPWGKMGFVSVVERVAPRIA